MKTAAQWIDEIRASGFVIPFDHIIASVQADALKEADPLVNELQRLRDLVGEPDIECIDLVLAEWEKVKGAK